MKKIQIVLLVLSFIAFGFSIGAAIKGTYDVACFYWLVSSSLYLANTSITEKEDEAKYWQSVKDYMKSSIRERLEEMFNEAEEMDKTSKQ